MKERNAVISGFYGDPRSLRICDLLVRGVPELTPSHARLSPDMIIGKIRHRWQQKRSDLEQIMCGRIEGLGRFDDMAAPQHFTTYKQLMEWVTQHIGPRAHQWVSDAYKNDEDVGPDINYKRAEWVMRLFASPSQDLTAYRQFVHVADAKYIDLNGYIPLVMNKVHRPQLGLERLKTIDSTLDKVAKNIVSQIPEDEVQLVLALLEDQLKGAEENRAKSILYRAATNVSANDSFGAGVIYNRLDEVYAALEVLKKEHKRGNIRIAYDRKGKDAVRDFIREQRDDGPSHGAVHVNIYPLSGGPDLIEIQLMTLDAFIVDIFHPEVGHFKYRRGWLHRAQAGAMTMPDGHVVRQEWGPKQHKLCHLLYMCSFDTYKDNITIN